MSQNLADQIEAVPACDGHRGETVPQVMQANVLKPGVFSDPLPVVIEINEMPIFSAAWEDVRVAFDSGNFRQGFKRGGSQGYYFGPGLGVGQTQTTAFRIDVVPLESENFGFPGSRENQQPDCGDGK